MSECRTPRRWSSQGGDEQSCFGAIYDFTKRMVADPARGLHGGLKILPHGLLKTWGEPCGARVKRRCGVMTAAPAETCSVPSVRDAWQMWRDNQIVFAAIPHRCMSADGGCLSKLDTMRWQFRLPAYSCDFESTMITLTDRREYSLWKSSLHEKKLLKS